MTEPGVVLVCNTCGHQAPTSGRMESHVHREHGVGSFHAQLALPVDTGTGLEP